MHMPFQLRFCSSATAAAATFLAVSRLIDSPYSGGFICSGTFSLGLFGSGGTWASAPVPVASAKHKAPAITVKRRITSSLRTGSVGLCPAGEPTRSRQTGAAYRTDRVPPTGESAMRHNQRRRIDSARVADQRLLLAAEQHQDG